MLLFNAAFSVSLTLVFQISIHLMLLFNTTGKDRGSSEQNFNTSNVTIQLIELEAKRAKTAFQYI